MPALTKKKGWDAVVPNPFLKGFFAYYLLEKLRASINDSGIFTNSLIEQEA
jgi:hypothetical protein